MVDRSLLDDDQITERLAGVPGWTREGDELRRELEFADFSEAFGFISMVALIAEKLDHHPELWNTWNKVRLAISTHDAGGITDLDFEFAERANKALGES